MYRAVFCIGFTLFVLSLAPRARASETFPPAIQAQLMLRDPPPCILCHQTPLGGLKSITQPFGLTIQQKYKLILGDVAGLRTAIMSMQMAGDDSDGDGVGDIAELIQGTDPNVPEGGAPIAGAPRYGCYCSAVGGASTSTGAGVAWLSGLALSAWRRRRATHRPGERET